MDATATCFERESVLEKLLSSTGCNLKKQQIGCKKEPVYTRYKPSISLLSHITRGERSSETEIVSSVGAYLVVNDRRQLFRLKAQEGGIEGAKERRSTPLPSSSCLPRSLAAAAAAAERPSDPIIPHSADERPDHTLPRQLALRSSIALSLP